MLTKIHELMVVGGDAGVLRTDRTARIGEIGATAELKTKKNARHKSCILLNIYFLYPRLLCVLFVIQDPYGFMFWYK